jgi:hypothetical protein
MATSLADFQDAFAAALRGEPCPGPIADLVAQPGFRVYRNTAVKGATEALLANFPSLVRILGRPRMHALALAYLADQPPFDASLVRYGASFPAWIAGRGEAMQAPLLKDLAHLDWLWLEAHTAPDAAALAADALAGMEEEALAVVRLALHPSVRWHRAAAPVHALWRDARDWPSDEDDGEHDVGVLVFRPAFEVRSMALDAGACAFLDHCAAGEMLGDAIATALDRHPQRDPQRWLARMLSEGVFVDGIH